MNILLLMPTTPRANAPGALALVFHALLTGLRQRHRVTVLTVTGTDVGEREAVEAVRQSGVRIIAPALFPARRLQRLGRWMALAARWGTSTLPLRALWFHSPQLQHACNQLCTSEHFDVIHVEDNVMGMYVLPRATPAIFTEHEVRKPRAVNWHTFGRAGLHAWTWSEMEWQRLVKYQMAVWRRFPCIQTFTETDAATIRAMMPNDAGQIFVNPFGVFIPPAPLDPQREVKYRLIFVGNFYHAPNVDAALFLGQEIMPLLRNQMPEARLMIVGASPPDNVRKLACKDIDVQGYVPDIEPLLAEAAVIVAPVRIGGGMRMKVLHNMAHGKAVVTTQRGASGLEINGMTPPLRIADTPAEIAQHIASLMCDDNARRRLGCQARAYVMQHFSPEAHALRVERCYAAALAGSRGHGAA